MTTELSSHDVVYSAFFALGVKDGEWDYKSAGGTRDNAKNSSFGQYSNYKRVENFSREADDVEYLATYNAGYVHGAQLGEIRKWW